MAIIRLRGLSLCEAEEAIATLWSCLEEYGIPTPHIGFRFESADQATLSLRIDSEWHHVVERCVTGGMLGAALGALDVETEDDERARFRMNARAIVSGGRERKRGLQRTVHSEAENFHHRLARREILELFAAADRSTFRSIQ